MYACQYLRETLTAARHCDINTPANSLDARLQNSELQQCISGIRFAKNERQIQIRTILVFLSSAGAAELLERRHHLSGAHD